MSVTIDLVVSLMRHMTPRERKDLLMAVIRERKRSCFYCADCDADFGTNYQGLFDHVGKPSHQARAAKNLRPLPPMEDCQDEDPETGPSPFDPSLEPEDPI